MKLYRIEKNHHLLTFGPTIYGVPENTPTHLQDYPGKFLNECLEIYICQNHIHL